jgi:hypothetical protein
MIPRYTCTLVLCLSFFIATGAQNDRELEIRSAPVRMANAPRQFKYSEETKIAFPQSSFFDGFGKSVAINGRKVLVGSHAMNAGAAKSGSAFLYSIDDSGQGWTLLKQFQPENPGQYDYFGWSVDLTTYYLIIGSWEDDDNGATSGSVSIYRRSGDEHFEEETWFFSAKFAGVSAGDSFGISVIISDSGLAAVGAPGGKNADGVQSGYVTILRLSSGVWMKDQVLTASDGASADNFGISLSLSSYDNTLVVGAMGANGKTGRAYVFGSSASGTEYSEVASLSPSNGAQGDSFGHAVAIYNDVVVVGADHTFSSDTSGAVYVFKKVSRSSGTTYEEAQILTPGSPCNLCFFGTSVAAYGNSIVVGSKNMGVGSTYPAGFAYYYLRSSARSSYTEVFRFNATDRNNAITTSDQVSFDCTCVPYFNVANSQRIVWSSY